MTTTSTTTESRYRGAGVSWRPATDTVEIGELISGTLRTQDLLLPILEELTRVDRKRGEWHLADLLDMGFGGDEERGIVLDETPRDEIYDSEVQESIDAMMDALTDAAPEAIYFGGHPSDGAAIGYWPESDWKKY